MLLKTFSSLSIALAAFFAFKITFSAGLAKENLLLKVTSYSFRLF
jgi:hypothetical protein